MNTAWPVAPLGGIADFLNGGTPSRKKPAYFEGDIPWITGADISEGQVFVSNARSHITPEAIQHSATNLVPAGTILLVTRTGVGKAAVAAVDLAYSQDITAIVHDQSRVDRDYLVRCLLAQSQRFVDRSQGATIRGITRTVVEETLVPLPPIEEQRRIAAILDAADALRAKRRQVISKVGTLTQAIFIDMFGDGKLNPNRWPVAPIGSLIADARGGASLKPEDFASTGFPVLHKGAIKPGGVIEPDVGKKTYARAEYARSKPGSVVTREFTVVTLRDLVPSGPSIGLSAYLGDAPYSEYLLAQGAYGFRLDQTRVGPEYFVALSNDVGFRTVFKRFSVGSTQIHIRNPIYKKIKVPIPPLDLQHRFAAIVESVERQKASQHAHLNELDTVFASLQQRAFRGEL